MFAHTLTRKPILIWKLLIRLVYIVSVKKIERLYQLRYYLTTLTLLLGCMGMLRYYLTTLILLLGVWVVYRGYILVTDLLPTPLLPFFLKREVQGVWSTFRKV